MVFRLKLGLYLLVSLLLVSCSENKNVVIEALPAEELAVQRWQAMIANDFELGYAYESPAYRSTYTQGLYAYQFSGRVDWREIELVDSKKISDDLTEVELELKYLYGEGSDFEQLLSNTITEHWILVEDQWWHVANF